MSLGDTHFFVLVSHEEDGCGDGSVFYAQDEYRDGLLEFCMESARACVPYTGPDGGSPTESQL